MSSLKKPNESSETSYLVRQDRIPSDPEQTILKFENQGRSISLGCANLSSFGVGALSDKDLKLSLEDQVHCSIFFDGFCVAETAMKVVRMEKTLGESLLYGFEVMGEPICLEIFKGLEMGLSLKEKVNELLKRTVEIPAPFLNEVLVIKEFLNSMKSEVLAAGKEISKLDPSERETVENTLVQSFSKYISELIPTKTTRLQEIWETYDDDMKIKSANFFRSTIEPLLFSAPFAQRAYYKPRGYAGDYEMMNQLYKMEFIGPDLFSKCLHYYFVSEPAAQAVRNRADYMIGKIKKLVSNNMGKKVRILSIASGPAWEVQNWFKEFGVEYNGLVEFILLDQDEVSLKHAQKKINTYGRSLGIRPNVQYICKDIKSLINSGLQFKDFDLIYSAGLFDYLSAPVANLAGKQLFSLLNPGGSLIIGNFNFGNPTLPIMNLVLDWQLIYRTEQQMIDIFKDISPKLEVEQEDLNINLFAVLKKDERG